jgi:archaellin
VTGGTQILQTGKLQDGRNINKAIRRGQTVTVTVQNDTGAVATFQFTRP